ncbi:zinc finger protein 26-like [Frieseomelitta varia]|uniref:zinc finger protein 26-like n=1 Tax=Frieseomelitta varia TaxID=561572 RepID=UPI001CB6894D|nr:zinc finger protein 26-like [Frieseomelitta varia]XP_043516974.1 zinc finger protein 26-like [Frieseomelitta varia]XP_043516975.1 zinc finger protein 26-like [Frieseomelitta varia]XP_043516977.1 zinc finger protein 26-like [Frieseomelitta varia]XP_043516978.1 zinc finger protein 26-like [Frieseomelitta varia]
MEEVIDQTIATEQTSEECLSHEEEDIKVIIPINEGMLKHENQDNECLENITTVEHDYILQQECVLSNANEQEQEQQQHHHHYQHQLTSGESFQREDYTEYVNLLVKAADATIKQDEAKDEEEKLDITNTDVQPEADSQYQNETRRSKRKLVRRICETKRDSDEENYFENLNLSSRLKKDQSSDQSEKIFLCYLCDKEFLSKNVLKEHMHSHEEVRKVLSLKRTPDTPQKDSYNVAKSPPSGKRSNKCPYCGKQYIYITSFSKHLKKHEREKEEGKEDSMPLEISFHEDEHSLDLDDYKDARRNLNTEYRKKVKQKEMGQDDHGEEEQGNRVKNCNDGGGGGDDDGDGDDGGGEGEGREGNNNNNNNDDDVNDDTDDYEYDDCENGKRLGNSNRKEEQESRTVRTETFACDRCTKKFSTKRSLRKHAISHTLLNCSICEDEFDSLEKLRNHRAKHVVEGVLTEQELEMDKEYAIKKETLGYEIGNKESAENDDGIKDEPMAGLLEIENNSAKKNDRNTEIHRHSGINHSCKMCCQQFATKEMLQKHMEQQHERVKTYKCTQCNKTFGNELTLRNHLIATNHKTFLYGQEYDPNKRIKRVAARAAQKIIDKIKTEDGLEDYDEEEENNDRINRVNSTDGNYTRNKREISSQRRHNYKKELECASCNKRCSSKQSLTKHMEQHVKDEQQRVIKSEKQKQSAEKKEWQKDYTNEKIYQKENRDDDYDSDFESGLDWPMDNHECAKCKKRYSTKKSLLRHQLLHEEPNFECDICNVKFYRKDKLKAHYDKCSEKNPDQVRKCNICGDTFENNEILREHRSKHVTEGILTEEDLRDIEPRPEEKKPGEKIGRKRRTDIVGLECTECNKQYTSRKGLLRHIQVHEGKKYLCDICPKKFYRREHLKIHVAKHNMIKPYKCTRCTKRFIKEEQLTNHLSKHDRTFKKNKETDSSKRFLCEICSKSFTQSTTLIAHLRAHNGIKPYVCEVCSRPFTTNAYLKMHMRTHTQERPYICQYCSRAFARADTLANHLTSHTGEAKYHCKYCPKNFRRLKSLKEHVFIHTGQRPYACPTCDRRFNNNGSRYAHSKRCKQTFVQNQNRAQALSAQVQTQQTPHTQQTRVLQQTTLEQGQIVKPQNIKTITITKQPESVTTQQTVMQLQEILMPLILPLTVTLTDVGEEVILPEGTKIFTTS